MRSVILMLITALVLSGCTAPVRIEWRTETEINTAGFNLYRGQSPDGPFDVKVNDQLIPPAADPLTGKSYVYIDRTAQMGMTYYYQLQEVEKSGRVNTYGPISVRAGGFTGWHALVLVLLAMGVVALWVFGRKEALRPRANGQ